MILGIVILAIFGFFVGILVLINLALVLVLAAGLLLSPIWIPLSSVILTSPRRYQ